MHQAVLMPAGVVAVPLLRTLILPLLQALQMPVLRPLVLPLPTDLPLAHQARALDLAQAQARHRGLGQAPKLVAQAQARHRGLGQAQVHWTGSFGVSL